MEESIWKDEVHAGREKALQKSLSKLLALILAFSIDFSFFCSAGIFVLVISMYLTTANIHRKNFSPLDFMTYTITLARNSTFTIFF